MSDATILENISALVEEEKKLRSAGSAAGNAARLKQVEEQLDQCWDLLRQRQARREFGGDADDAHARPVAQVESYLQ